jgi:cytochrome c551/c552
MKGAAAIVGVLLIAAVARPQNTSPDRALLNQYCAGCHNEKLKTAGLMLDKLDLAHPGQDPEVWEKVVRKLRAGMMPPAGMPRPDRATLDLWTGKLETELDRAAAAKPNPGSTGLHRLNRTEYTNAIRDLLAIDVDGSTVLPADDSSEGFDNIADALAVSPALIAVGTR